MAKNVTKRLPVEAVSAAKGPHSKEDFATKEKARSVLTRHGLNIGIETYQILALGQNENPEFQRSFLDRLDKRVARLVKRTYERFPEDSEIVEFVALWLAYVANYLSFFAAGPADLAVRREAVRKIDEIFSEIHNFAELFPENQEIAKIAAEGRNMPSAWQRLAEQETYLFHREMLRDRMKTVAAHCADVIMRFNALEQRKSSVAAESDTAKVDRGGSDLSGPQGRTGEENSTLGRTEGHLIDEQNPNEILNLYVKALRASKAKRPMLASKIRHMAAAALSDEFPRAQWLEERNKPGSELGMLTALPFLRRVYADVIGSEGFVFKEYIREMDSDLMSAVDSYLSQRTGRSAGLGNAHGLTFIASRPAGRPRRAKAKPLKGPHL